MSQPEKKVILIQPAGSTFNWGEKANEIVTAGIFTVAAYTPRVPLSVIADNGHALSDQLGSLKHTLVGITGTTPMADRIVELMGQTVEEGGFVAIGGTDATLRADNYEQLIIEKGYLGKATVVKGEIEGGSWEKGVLRDFLAGKPLRSNYETPPTDLKGMPIPRDSILNQVQQGLNWQRVSSARGCVRKIPCDFCTVHLTAGLGKRSRPNSEMIEEIRARGLFNRDNQQGVIFTSDNFGSVVDKKLLELIYRETESQFPFFIQAELGTLRDRELLQAVSQFYKPEIGIGIESAFRPELSEVKKGIKNLDPVAIFEEARKICPQVSLTAFIMLGFDFEPEDRFQQTLEFLSNLKPDVVYVNVVTPYPQTPLREKLLDEGRLTNRDNWSEYTGKKLNFHPVHTKNNGSVILCSPEEFMQGYDWLKGELEKILPTWSKEVGNPSYPYLVI